MSYTKTTHNTSYAAIAPSNPGLSTRGKTILITGGGSGIGLATAYSYAAAGASTIIILGRRASVLAAAAEALKTAHPATEVQTHSLDVTDAEAVKAAVAAAGGHIDIAIHAAASMTPLASLATADLDELWAAFEANYRGTLHLARALLEAPAAGAGEAKETVLVVVNTAGTMLPPVPFLGTYATSKLAVLKLAEYLGAENPGRLRVTSVHPGVVQTEGAAPLAEKGLVFPQYDDVSLSADFLLWAGSDDAAFLRGKFVFANWDVDELKARKAEIEGGADLTVGLNGFPRQF